MRRDLKILNTASVTILLTDSIGSVASSAFNLDKTYAGYEPGFDEEKNIVRDCFLRGIVDLCFDDNFNVSRLFNNKGIKWLEELFSSDELKEMKKFLVKGRDNISSTIEKFPD